MQRIPCPERDDWRATAESTGFSFHTIGGERYWVERALQDAKSQAGLDEYQVRQWNGWHHHVTLVMLAHSFLTLETLRSKKNFWVDPSANAP